MVKEWVELQPNQGKIRAQLYSLGRVLEETTSDTGLIQLHLEIDQAEAILRVDQGNKVSDMTSKEIKRDVLLYARKAPRLFMDLVQDENVELRNVGIKAVEAGILTLSPDNRAFNWSSNNRKVMTVPFEEHPYSALAAWFKTDDGIEMFKAIEKRLK